MSFTRTQTLVLNISNKITRLFCIAHTQPQNSINIINNSIIENE